MADPSRTPSPPGSGGFSLRTGLVDAVEMGLEMAVAGRLRPWIRPAGPDPRGPPGLHRVAAGKGRRGHRDLASASGHGFPRRHGFPR